MSLASKGSSSSRSIISGVLKALAKEIPAYLCRDFGEGVESAICVPRLEKCITYDTEGGKYARACTVYDSYKLLRPEASQEELTATSRVAATMELLQANFLILDDILDQGKKRRGKACYWRLPGIGISALNDAAILSNSIDWVVHTAIPQHPRLGAVLKAITEAKLSTHTGEVLQLTEWKLEDFSWSRYTKASFQVADKKTANYSFYLPLALGFHLANVSFKEEALRLYSRKAGRLFQAQNDVIDCYACVDPRIKSGTCEDLAEGNCTWVTLRVLEKLKNNDKQRHLLSAFLQHFGHAEPEHVEAAAAIVRELGIWEEWKHYRDGEVRELHTYIDEWEDAAALRQMLHADVERIKIDN